MLGFNNLLKLASVDALGHLKTQIHLPDPFSITSTEQQLPSLHTPPTTKPPQPNIKPTGCVGFVPMAGSNNSSKAAGKTNRPRAAKF